MKNRNEETPQLKYEEENTEKGGVKQKEIFKKSKKWRGEIKNER